MTRRAIFSAAFGLAVLGAGCAHQKAQAPEIKDEWVARVPPEQLGPVKQAQAERRRAEDELTRAKVAVNDADNEVSVKRSIRSSANKRVDASKKAVDAARQTGDQNQIKQAQTGLQSSEHQRSVADAEFSLAEKQRDLAKAKQDFADAHLKTEDALVKQAEYQVLKEAGDTRVKNIDPLKFETAITAARNNERQAQIEISDQQSQVASAEQNLQNAKQQTAIGGGGQQDEL